MCVTISISCVLGYVCVVPEIHTFRSNNTVQWTTFHNGGMRGQSNLHLSGYRCARTGTRGGTGGGSGIGSGTGSGIGSGSGGGSCICHSIKA